MQTLPGQDFSCSAPTLGLNLTAVRIALQGLSADGPSKPDFGLSGAVRWLDRVFPRRGRVCLQPSRTQLQPIPRVPLRDGESAASLWGALAQSRFHSLGFAEADEGVRPTQASSVGMFHGG